MPQHDIEITISKTGEVRVHIKGAKGKACMDYAKWLSNVIGNVKDQKLTSEYYEPDETNRIKLEQELREE
ncbi:hypothetical protein SMSP2_02089 [Limihaloglobus sulfuriphilus]|uniref:DUF2997 domain-containing protein n=1 Tax=Limihaloglobus sulfuriphilus TaxID=1851148 RepID=A0A1Q2MHI6_9BACT|nr:DUF2997 domain-containing protein [Limihaloglobus sulfuriphilus]AQQ71712.1 hypothetical protein SMSP2_02089 [Limihaloglobus sulfuriphilus]